MQQNKKKMSCPDGIRSIVSSSSWSSSSCAIFLVRFLIFFVYMSFDRLSEFRLFPPPLWPKSRRRKRDTNGKGCEIDLALCLRQCVSHDFFYHFAVFNSHTVCEPANTIIGIFECVENATRSQCVKNDHRCQRRTWPTLTRTALSLSFISIYLSGLDSPHNRKSVVDSFCFLPFECGRCTQCAQIHTQKIHKRQCDHFVALVLFIRFDSFHFSWCPLNAQIKSNHLSVDFFSILV